jgi:hypothetical protein
MMHVEAIVAGDTKVINRSHGLITLPNRERGPFNIKQNKREQ